MDRVQTKLPNQKMLWAGFALASRLDVGQIRADTMLLSGWAFLGL